jgi:lipopolysaccharide export system protein LptC
MFPRAVTAAKDPVMQLYSNAHQQIKLNIDRAALAKNQMIRANLSREMEAVTVEPIQSDMSSNKFMDSLDINSKEFGTP